MHFRLQEIVTGLPLELEENESLEFLYGGKRQVVLRLRTPVTTGPTRSGAAC